MLTSVERMSRILRHESVDRVGLFEVYWRETAEAWAAQGHLPAPEAASDHFGLDLRRTGGEVTPASWKVLDLVADLDAGETVLEESESSRLVRDGNGALLRRLKRGSGAPEHVDFTVRDRGGWQEHIRPCLVDEKSYERRIDFARYRELRSKCEREPVFMTCAVVGAFDLMSPMCGHENLLAGMALDGEWVHQMALDYTELTIHLLEVLFSREGLPDGLWVWDDLGLKGRPFMSPAMYREVLFPAHRRLFDFAHSRGLPVVLHCDGYVEALLPALIEAGVDCLQPIEVKAGMDVIRLKKAYGEKLALIGGIDATVLESNDFTLVQAELERKLPAAMEGSGYILQSDHSISHQVSYETYRAFVARGLEIGTY